MEGGVRRDGCTGLQVYQQQVTLLLVGRGLGCAGSRQAQQGLQARWKELHRAALGGSRPRCDLGRVLGPITCRALPPGEQSERARQKRMRRRGEGGHFVREGLLRAARRAA